MTSGRIGLASLAVILTAFLAFPGVVSADGILIPEPVLHVLPHPEAFAVKYHHVKVDIDHQTANTVIDQVFRNPNNTELEATYLFPIPESASIQEFSLWMNGRKVSGEVLEAWRAREIYESIVRRMKDPGLLEYAGRNLFRARVYPVPARGEVKIEISYREVLPYDAGLVSYRYPLNTEKFSSADLEDVTVHADIRSDVPIKSVYSPSHDIDVSLRGRAASCGWEARNVRPDRDFLLYYTVSERDMGLSLVTHRLAGEDGYFMLLLSPGRLDEDRKVMDKDVVFVLDTSGSMAGEKIEQARRALRYCLQSLNRGDRFNLITFATDVNPLEDGLVRADGENVRRALQFIDRIVSRGGTDIDGALRRALAGRSSENPLIVVFLTDGQPTVGETDVNRIIAGARERNRDARVFPFGVGYDVNTHLLDQLAADNGGTVEYLRPEEDIEVKVSGFFSKVSSPVLADLSLDFGGMRVSDLCPPRLPDLFSGTQTVVFGRYRGEGHTAVRLTGRASGERREFVFEGRFDGVNEDNDFIPRLWATRKIAYLMSEIRLRGENRELVDEVIRLAREHGIVTPYTSYLVMEEGSEEDRRAFRPMERAMAPAVDSVRQGMKLESGRDAFSLSQGMVAAKEATVVEKPAADGVKHVGRKSFLGSASGWAESSKREAKEVIELTYLSDGYFKFLTDNPGAGKFLALGKNVTFTFKGKTYRVVD